MSWFDTLNADAAGSNQTDSADNFSSITPYGDWLQGFGSILSGFAGYKQYQLGKDQLAFSKDAFAFNKDMQVATALAQAQGRLAEQQAYGGRQDLGYLQGIIQTLQGYGQGGQNNSFADTLKVEGAMNQLNRYEAAQEDPALAAARADWEQSAPVSGMVDNTLNQNLGNNSIQSGLQQTQQQNTQALLNQPAPTGWGDRALPTNNMPRDTAIRPDDLRFPRR